jgi:tetratricopeptide (TPR) repeat protein
LDDVKVNSLDDQIKLKIIELEVKEHLSMDSLATIVKSKNTFDIEKAAVGKYALERIEETLKIYQDAFNQKAIEPAVTCILTNFKNSFSSLKKGDVQDAFINCLAGLKLILGNDVWGETVANVAEVEILSRIDNIAEQQGVVMDNSCEELYGLDDLGTVLSYKIYAYMCLDSDETYKYFKMQANSLYGNKVWMFDINADIEYLRKEKYDKAIRCLKNAVRLRKNEFEIEKYKFIEDCIHICEKWCNCNLRADAIFLYAIICWCIRLDIWNWKTSEQNMLYYAIADTCFKYGDKMDAVTYYDKGREQ